MHRKKAAFLASNEKGEVIIAFFMSTTLSLWKEREQLKGKSSGEPPKKGVGEQGILNLCWVLGFGGRRGTSLTEG